jgi:hypothetical protein
MKQQLRELREDVENDKYDKRRKFGEDSFPVFKAGTRFLLNFHKEGSKMEGMAKEAQLVDRDTDNNEIIVTGGKLVKLFYASSREVAPNSIADLMAMHTVAAEPLLDILLEQGRITIMDVDQACVVVRDRQTKELRKKMGTTVPTTTDTSTNTTPTPSA